MPKLSPKFIAHQYKPKDYRTDVLRYSKGTSFEDAKKQYLERAKTANKRISDIEKGGYHSYALDKVIDALGMNSFDKQGSRRFRFNLKDVKSMEDLKNATNELNRFLASDTSTKTGLIEHLQQVSDRFHLPRGEYESWAHYSERTAEYFNLMEEMLELAEQGIIEEDDRYRVLNALMEADELGYLDDPNMTFVELAKEVDKLAKNARKARNSRRGRMHYSNLL